MPQDEALLVKDLFVPLLHSSYKCFTKDSEKNDDTVDLSAETFMANTQLPAFVGRFYERLDNMLDNTWAVFGG